MDKLWFEEAKHSLGYIPHRPCTAITKQGTPCRGSALSWVPELQQCGSHAPRWALEANRIRLWEARQAWRGLPFDVTRMGERLTRR